jgi:hypothetical protein
MPATRSTVSWPITWSWILQAVPVTPSIVRSNLINQRMLSPFFNVFRNVPVR